ncbi:MAG: LTA synthase family protein [Lachnospiraceae bacterium]|nr:LTA synthase family protein [Lachnospiraceae bacterium]
MTNENTAGYLKYMRKVAGILLLLFMPVISYILFEYVTENLKLISAERAILNILWILTLYLFLFVVSGSSRFSVPVVSLLVYVISLAEAFVVSFRGTPIMIWDILAFQTAMSVAENYVFEFSNRMQNAGIALAVCNVVLWFFPIRIKGWKKRAAAVILGTGTIAGFAVFFFTYLVSDKMLEINMWSMNDTYQEYGYFLSTAVSLKYMVKKPPQGYSLTKLRQIGSQLEDEAAEDEQSEERTGIQPVNLICIMNESLSELKVAGDFTTNQEYFPFINSLQENTVRGSLCVPVFGSMTSNTEFEFLTGDTVAMLPTGSIAYQFYVKPDAATLVSTLKDQGYYSVAMHPYPAENWNRDVCYQNMGFDEFLSWDSYNGSEFLRNYVSDQSDYQKIIDAVEGKETPQDRLFIFNVTMQNHGGYEEAFENFQQQIYLTGRDEGKYPQTDQYLSLMKESDEAFRFLLEYFSECREPTMIVMFGDHQPSVEDEFYDAIAGVPSSEVPDAQRLMWYQTPFIIWTNYEQPAQDMGKLGTVFLASKILDLANLEMTPYQRFLLNMSYSLPVVHPIGVYEPDGMYYSWEFAESEACPYQELVLCYEYLVYNHSLDSRKLRELYVLP